MSLNISRRSLIAVAGGLARRRKPGFSGCAKVRRNSLPPSMLRLIANENPYGPSPSRT